MTTIIERLHALPDTGRYTVDTLTSAYLFDLDTGIVERLDLADEATGRVAIAEVFMFDSAHCMVGEPMRIHCTPARTGDKPHVRTSSAVLGITPTDKD